MCDAEILKENNPMYNIYNDIYIYIYIYIYTHKMKYSRYTRSLSLLEVSLINMLP